MTRNLPTEPPGHIQLDERYHETSSQPRGGEPPVSSQPALPVPSTRTSHIPSQAPLPQRPSSIEEPPEPALKLLPITYEDIPAIVDVHISAYRYNALTQLGNQGITDDERRKAMIAAIRDGWKKSSPALWPIKAVRTSDGKVVGAAIWDVYDRKFKKTPEVAAQQKVERQAVMDMASVLRGGTVVYNGEGAAGTPSTKRTSSLQDATRDAVHGLHVKWTNDDNRFMYLATIAVDLSSQSLGVGRALLHHGMSRADSEGLAIWLEATAAGHPVYEHYGWKTVDSAAIDLEKYGGRDSGYGVYKFWGCIRLPVFGAKT